MSDISQYSTDQAGEKTPVSIEKTGLKSASGTASKGSLLERFLNSFFQEKNIRWLLLMGAAIIFGSSLMLVTRAWPHWSATLRAFTVLAYTASLFGAGHFCRVRLQLNLTYKVLYGLTVLLIPISFLSLSWLSSGIAAQQGVLRSALIVPFLVGTAFLWVAAKSIFDHVLRTRQTTFLISYCLLCMAGALPQLISPVTAFVFLMVTWAVMTAGVLKVNRHVFGLALQHQVPRVFGFLPIALLGTLFIVLVGVLAVPALPIHWLGFGCVMLAATILLTAKSLMDVFRQSTGDLVRPFPWSIGAPLIVGLCLTVVGVGLSFAGFSYVSASTFAVVPTAVIAAGLMILISIQTRHTIFTWFALIFVTIAYQSCPVLFADVVQSLKETTADAIRRERVPVSMYGLTYVPLLLGLVVAVRQLKQKFLNDLAAPVQRFLVLLNSVLIMLSFQDVVSAFIVAVTNVVLFASYGLILRERRFGYLSILSVVVAVGLAIPALNDMQYTQISLYWVAPLLSAVAVGLTVFSWPDRVLGKIQILETLCGKLMESIHPIGPGDTAGTYAAGTHTAEGQSAAVSSAQGHSSAVSLPLLQTLGSLMAIVLTGHWMITVAIDIFEPLSLPALVQFGCLMAALVFYTLRNPQYFTGLCCHSLCLFVAVRWGLGESFPTGVLLNTASAASLGFCFMTGLVLKQAFGISVLSKLLDVGRGFGWTSDATSQQLKMSEHSNSNRGWRSRVQAFVVPCFDLSFWAFWSLVAFVHLPALVLLNLPIETAVAVPAFFTLWTTPVILLTLVGAALFARVREIGVVGMICLPLLVTAYHPLFEVSLTLTARLLIWLAMTTAMFLMAHIAGHRSQNKVFFAALRNVTLWMSVGMLVVSCIAASAVLSTTALLACLLIFVLAGSELGPAARTGLAILGNLHAVVTVVATVNMTQSGLPAGMGQAIVFAMCGAGMLVFRAFQSHLNAKGCRAWIGVLLSIMVVLFGVCCSAYLSVMATSLVLLGLLLVGTYELLEAISKQSRTHVHAVWAILFATGFFFWVQAFGLLNGIVVPYLMLAISFGLLVVERQIKDESAAAIFRKDLVLLARVFPAVMSVAIVGGSFLRVSSVTGAHSSFILMMCAGTYGYLFQREQRFQFAILGLVLLNVALGLLWESLSWASVEFYMVPAGFSVLAFSRVLRKDLPESGRRALQYVGSLMILLSPVLQVLDGSWQHMLLLLILSVVIIVAAIGFRACSLVYCGTGFLLVDLLAMVVQSTNDSPTLLWAIGILTGIGLMALAAYCERHREQLLSRIRMLSSELATWD